MSQGRHDEIADGLAAVRERIDRACADARRSADDITTIVVTKFFPSSDVRLLADLGVLHVGENRHQEAVEKAAECADLGLSWHFIGALQSNKAAAVAGYAGVVHSVDRAKLVGGLSRGAQERKQEIDCLVQVSLDPPEASGRSGAAVGEISGLAERILDADGLRLRGVMGVAPLGGDAREAFDKLAEQAEVDAHLPHRAHSLFPLLSWRLSAAPTAALAALRTLLDDRPRTEDR